MSSSALAMYQEGHFKAAEPNTATPHRVEFWLSELMYAEMLQKLL